MYVCTYVRVQYVYVFPQTQVSRSFPGTGAGPPEFQKTLPQAQVSRGFPSTGSANSFPTGGPCSRAHMYVRMCVCMYVRINIYIYIYIYIYVCLRACKFVCMYVCMYVCRFVKWYVCICFGRNVYRYVEVYLSPGAGQPRLPQHRVWPS